MALFGGGSKSKFEVKTFPGIFNDPSATKAAGFGEQISELVNQNISSGGADGISQPGTERPFFDQFTQQLDNPQLGPQGSGEASIIQQLVQQANAANTQSGFNAPATTGTITQAIAPQLEQFRQNRLANLVQGEQTFGGTELAERGQNIQSGTAQGGLDLNNFNSIINALQNLVSEAAPVRIGGTTTKTQGPGILDTLINLGSIASSAGAFSGGFNPFSGGDLNLEPQFG